MSALMSGSGASKRGRRASSGSSDTGGIAASLKIPYPRLWRQRHGRARGIVRGACGALVRTGGMSARNYNLVGTRVRVHLYTRQGFLLGALEGRVADVSGDVLVGTDEEGREIRKDLVYVVDIEPSKNEEGEPVPYKNSAGGEGEGWFAVQDVSVVRDGPPLMSN